MVFFLLYSEKGMSPSQHISREMEGNPSFAVVYELLPPGYRHAVCGTPPSSPTWLLQEDIQIDDHCLVGLRLLYVGHVVRFWC